MSSDFVFVEIEPETEHPIVDGVSLNRLEKEWNAVKMDLKENNNIIVKEVWENLLIIYTQLEKIDHNSALTFSNNCINDIAKVAEDIQIKKAKGPIFSFFISFMKTTNRTFLDIDEECSISILNSLLTNYKEIQPQFLYIFFHQFKADEIKDTKGNFPFVFFLIQSYSNDNSVAEASRTILIELITLKKENFNYLLNQIIDHITSLFCFFSEVSPTLFDHPHPTIIVKFIESVFNNIESTTFSEVSEKYERSLQSNLIGNIANLPPLIQFETLRFFFTTFKHKQTVSLFVQYVVQKESVFSQNIESWFRKWTSKSLNLFDLMLDLRSAALQTAFFYSDDIDSNASIFGFPDFPPNFIHTKKPKKIFAIDGFSIYRTFNEDLQNPSMHVVSVFKLISSLFSLFWSLPYLTDQLLLEVILKIAACGNEHTNAFCFTPGKGIYAQTQVLMMEAKRSEKPLMKLLAGFILAMKEIFIKLEI